jgi:putative oxidoreductase
MTKNNSASTSESASSREMVITRIFNAPRTILFKAFTDQKDLARWWGPKLFTNPVCEIDVREGGAILIHMRSPDGTVYPMSGIYHKIIEPDLLVFTSAALDEKENPLFNQSNTVMFMDQGSQTKLVLHVSVSNITAAAVPFLAGMHEGWTQSFERLESFVYEQTRGRTKIFGVWSKFAPYIQSMLRIVSAIMFMLAGTMKLFAFPAGVPPNGGTVPLMSQMGMGGILEVFGGALLLLGLFTRPVAYLLAGEMAIAYFQFHAPGGFWPILNGGMPAVLYCFIWLYFSAAGAGVWSIDALRKK